MPIKNVEGYAQASFWQTLPRPFFVLAPMANVTDVAFRAMIATYGKPDVMWNEFVSADGLDSPGREKLLLDLRFSNKERPIVAQLFTGNPAAMKKAARLCAELGYDGVDINMGCPDRAVDKQGGGAASIKDPESALAVLKAAREGWEEGKGDTSLEIRGKKQKGKIELSNKGIIGDTESRAWWNVPVTIKTRIGYNKVDMDWLKLLLEQHLPTLTIHLRTRKEMSLVPAHWELMPEIVKLRDEVQKDVPSEQRTLIIGNGDVESISEAYSKTKKYGCDGIMIGRGIFGTPWLFEHCRTYRDARARTPGERLAIMVEHAKLYEKTFRGIKNFAVMKKHFKAYVSGWDGAKELRVKLMETENARQVKEIVEEYMG